MISAIALCGGCSLYLFGHNAFQFRDHGTVSYLRLVVGIVAVALVPMVTWTPSTAALAALTGLLVGLAIYETIWSDHRNRLRTGGAEAG